MPLQWKELPGFPGYEINALGTVRSIARRVQLSNGKFRAYPKRYIQTRVNNWGYRQLKLSRNGITHTCYLHRLLGEAFLNNPENKPEINHKDGDKLNNSLDNLEWVTHQENMCHAFNTGLVNLKTKPVFDKCLNKVFPSARHAAEYYKMNPNTLRNMLSGSNANTNNCLSYYPDERSARRKMRAREACKSR